MRRVQARAAVPAAPAGPEAAARHHAATAGPERAGGGGRRAATAPRAATGRTALAALACCSGAARRARRLQAGLYAKVQRLFSRNEIVTLARPPLQNSAPAEPMAPGELPVAFDEVRPKNVEQLKLLNRVVFPVKYTVRAAACPGCSMAACHGCGPWGPWMGLGRWPGERGGRRRPGRQRAPPPTPMRPGPLRAGSAVQGLHAVPAGHSAGWVRRRGGRGQRPRASAASCCAAAARATSARAACAHAWAAAGAWVARSGGHLQQRARPRTAAQQHAHARSVPAAYHNDVLVGGIMARFEKQVREFEARRGRTLVHCEAMRTGCSTVVCSVSWLACMDRRAHAGHTHFWARGRSPRPLLLPRACAPVLSSGVHV